MGDRLRKSWCVWACIILEIVGAKIIGGNSSIYPFFTMGIVAIFELYILLKLPYSEKLWLYDESPNNPKCTQIRWIGLIPILAISYFLRTTLLYAFFYSMLLEAPTLYFSGTEESKNKVRADVLDNVKALAIVAIGFVGVLIFFRYMMHKSIFS